MAILERLTLAFVFSAGVLHFTAQAQAKAQSQSSTANEVLAEALATPQFNQTYIYSGCFVRAHWLAEKLEKRRIQTFKIFLLPVNSQERIQFALPGQRPAQWVYHVVVGFRLKGSEKISVMDPLISKKVISLKTWIHRIREQNQNLRLKWVQLPSSQYTWEPSFNEEFQKLGSAFSPEAMDFVGYQMEDLFTFESYE